MICLNSTTILPQLKRVQAADAIYELSRCRMRPPLASACAKRGYQTLKIRILGNVHQHERGKRRIRNMRRYNQSRRMGINGISAGGIG